MEQVQIDYEVGRSGCEAMFLAGRDAHDIVDSLTASQGHNEGGLVCS